ncbi:hypothetical protein MHA_0428 [Mannheimia haemolytica PHL213]|nr:hypothetical protein MHA_0428 [Mannheimia haemolytica PHL213]
MFGVVWLTHFYNYKRLKNEDILQKAKGFGYKCEV